MQQSLGRYQLRREIGRGAMGIVYEAYDEVLERAVAVKTVDAGVVDADERPAVLERFAREAKAAARITHPNIVTIFDYGNVDDVAYIVMEMIAAVPLKQRLKEQHRFSVDVADRMLTQLLDALEAAHRNGIVHRDIKPSNILVLPSGQIKVTDFGIARIDSSTLTQTGKTMGTPSYMAPEQLRGLPVDGRADLFSAGIVLYELLSGQRAFSGNTTAAMYRVLNESPQPLSTLNPSCSPHIDTVLAKALQKDPDARYANAEEFRNAWRRALEAPAQTQKVDMAPAAPAPQVPVSPGATPPEVATSPSETSPKVTVSPAAIPTAAQASTQRGPRWLVAILALGSVGLALAAYVAWERRAPPPNAASATSASGSPAKPATVASVAKPKQAENIPANPALSATPSSSATDVGAAKPKPSLPADSSSTNRKTVEGRSRTEPAVSSDDEIAEPTTRLELNMLKTLAANGRPVAMNKLGLAYREGFAVERDYAQAKKWFEDAARLGYAPAMQNLAQLYRDGKGVARNDDEAFAWYERAAAKSHPQAMNALGLMLLNGRGRAQDEKAAAEWFRRAAKGGDKAAMFNLASLYEYGHGVEKDQAAAQAWYARAAALGENRARERLAKAR